MTATEVEKKVVEPKVEEDSDDEVPALESAEGAAAAGEDAAAAGKTSRSEKKSRKTMAKLGLKPVSGCVRVSIKKSKTVLFVISTPEVYKSPSGTTYVIFGEAKMEDMTGEKEKEMVKAFSAATDQMKVESKVPEEEEEEEVDAEGLDEKDITIVMQQVRLHTVARRTINLTPHTVVGLEGQGHQGAEGAQR